MSKISNEAYRKFNRKREVGEHLLTLPAPPPIKEIANYGLPKHKQKFIPTPLPRTFGDWTEEEQEVFVDEENRRSEEGYWFFNNGNLEYITGHNYFYINWWKIKISEEGQPKRVGLPKFIDSDRDYYYLWDEVEKNPKCGGMVYITNRREGKSYKAVEIAYKRCIAWADSMSGIQSKTELDAKSVMAKMILGWTHLPSFFKPPDDETKTPTKALRFKPKNSKSNSEDYLNSEVNHRSTVSTAYDGEDLLTYLMDEAGKTKEANVYETLLVVLRTMVDGTDITGRCLVTSTVEDMVRLGGANLELIWVASDNAPDQLKHNGQTETSLFRLFKPSYYGLRGSDSDGVPFVDEYGYSDQERTKAYLQKEKDSLSGLALIAFRRQYPFTIEEAFQYANDTNPFNLKNINETMNYNRVNVNEDNLFRGRFEFRNGKEETIVDWIPDPNGPFICNWFPALADRNQFAWKNTRFGKQRYPTISKVAGGVDTFDRKYTSRKKNSKGAIHFMTKYNSMDPTGSYNFVLEYIHRPLDPDEFYWDVIKACVFFSCELLPETNKDGLVRFMEREGFYHYIIERPEDTHTDYSRNNTGERGVDTSGDKIRTDMQTRLWSYTHNHLGLDELGQIKKQMPFKRTLQDWADFDPNDWTPYDATVSSSLAIIAAETSKFNPKKKISKPKTPMFAKFDNSGIVSVKL